MERYISLSTKEVVNVRDGRRLGRVIDLEMNLSTGQVEAVVVADDKRRSFFKPRDEFIVPWAQICKVGDDCILVEADGISLYTE
nr:YlmC/YmxH family sporulation protein [bacterium]